MITHVQDDVSRQDPSAKKDKQSHEIEMQFAALEGQQKELAAALEDPAAYTPGGYATAINRDLSVVSHDLAA